VGAWLVLSHVSILDVMCEIKCTRLSLSLAGEPGKRPLRPANQLPTCETESNFDIMHEIKCTRLSLSLAGEPGKRPLRPANQLPTYETESTSRGGRTWCYEACALVTLQATRYSR